jgi:type III pantothenate kinase
MQSGLYYGYVGLVDGILARLVDELGEGTTVVGTGGEADLIASGSEFIREVNPRLTLLGLKMIYDRNR